MTAANAIFLEFRRYLPPLPNILINVLFVLVIIGKRGVGLCQR
jgi:hypothetical protein